MRSLGLKGQTPQFIEPEFSVGITALNLDDPEYLWPRRTMRLSQGIGQIAVAASFSQGAFTPVSGANPRLAVVEQLIITNTTAGGLTYFVDSQPNISVPAAAGTPRSALDDRAIPFNNLQPSPSFGLVTNANAVGWTGAGALTVSVPANSSLILPLNWVFTARQVLTTPAPSSLLIQNSTLNSPLNFSVVWRERNILASEQT